MLSDGRPVRQATSKLGQLPKLTSEARQALGPLLCLHWSRRRARRPTSKSAAISLSGPGPTGGRGGRKQGPTSLEERIKSGA